MTTGQSLFAAALPDTGAMDRLTLWASDANIWLRAHSADIAIASAAGLLVYLVLRTARRYVRRAAARQADANGIGATILRVLARTGHFFLIMVSIRLVVGYANPPELIGNTVRILFIIAATFQAAIWVREAILGIVRARAVQSGHEMLGSALSLINVLVSIALFAIAIIVVLDNVGVNVTGLIAGLGIGGIAIGLAAKGVFEDLFAALAIIFDRPFRVGETIGFEGRSATVERIGMKSTRLRALTGEEIIVSNTALLNKELSNYARLERRRMSFIIGVTYETPVPKLRALPDIARAIVEAQGHTMIRCGMTAFGASSIDYELQFDVLSDDYAVVFAARHAVGLTLIERFAAEGIGLAYPTQVSYTAAPDGTFVLPYSPAATES
jgi:small-conductance mechanosensitive channel